MTITPYSDRTAILSPILLLLKSRKFIVLLATVIVDLLVYVAPQAEGLRGELLTLITVIGMTFIGGQSAVDAIAAGKTAQPVNPEATAKELADELIAKLAPPAYVAPVQQISDEAISALADAIMARLNVQPPPAVPSQTVTINNPTPTNTSA